MTLNFLLVGESTENTPLLTTATDSSNLQVENRRDPPPPPLLITAKGV